MAKSPFSSTPHKPDQTKSRRPPKGSIPPPSRSGRPRPHDRSSHRQDGCRRGTNLKS